MRSDQRRIFRLATHATPRQWLIGTVIAETSIASLATGIALFQGWESRDKLARQMVGFICEDAVGG